MLLYTYMHTGLCVYYIYIVYACPSSMLTLDRAGGSLKATLSLQFTVCRLDAVLTSTEVIFFQWWLTSQIRQGADVISILLISHDEERDVRWVFGPGGWKPPGWTWNRSILGTIFSDQPNWRWFGIISGRNYKCVLLCDSWANRIVDLSSFPPHGTAARASRPRRCRSFSFSVAWGWCSKTLRISLSASLAMRALVPLTGESWGELPHAPNLRSARHRAPNVSVGWSGPFARWQSQTAAPGGCGSSSLPAPLGPLLANSWRSLPSILASPRDFFGCGCVYVCAKIYCICC